ncbi:MAG: transcription antitermination factor NusB [candidate division Zixibacteria bacterium]|nr:transcription antitermination factor NusB [candidate division Zixibacteria bacterium]
MGESPRRKARETVLQALYACEINDDDPDDIIDGLLDETSLSQKNADFARNYFNLVINNKDWADKIISGLAKNWDIKRIAELDRIILRMAMVEMKFMPDIPEKVVLNEAIELAKKYSTGESPSFINGILDNFLKNLENL